MATRGYNTWRLQEWGDPRNVRPIRNEFSQSQVAQWINPLVEEAADLLGEVMDAHAYPVYSAGAYNLRLITNGSVWSSHAWGISIDVNPRENRYTKEGLITDMPLSMIEDVYRIRCVESGQRVWKWGGDWDGDWDFDEHTVWDAMHFECIATPEELAGGVVFDGDLSDVEVFPIMFTKRGQKGPIVLHYQYVLTELGADLTFDGGPEFGWDGVYGGAVAGGVKDLVPLRADGTPNDGQEIGPWEVKVLDGLVAEQAAAEHDHDGTYAKRAHGHRGKANVDHEHPEMIKTGEPVVMGRANI